MSTAQKSKSIDRRPVDDESCQHVDNAKTDVSTAPKKSPYADTDIITLATSSASNFLIHRTILSQVVDLNISSAAIEDSNNIITLPSLNDATAHALIHYLYTGTYQPLHRPADTSSHYGHLANLYTTFTSTFPLPTLANLARQQIELLTSSPSSSLSIYDILSVARDIAFPHLSPNEPWFPDHLEGVIKDAALKDPALFTRAEFTDQIEGDRRFRQVVMKAIVESCAGAGSISSASVADSHSMDVEESVSAGTPTGTATLATAVIVHGDDDDDDNNNDDAGDKAEEDTHTASKSQSRNEPQALTLDEIDPTVTNAPEPFTDELGFEKTKTWQSQTQNVGRVSNPDSNDTDASPTAATAIVEGQGKHKRADSVVQSEASPSLSSPMQEDTTVPIPAGIVNGTEKGEAAIAASGNSLLVNGNGNGNGNVVLGKKSKKNKKKKATAN